MWVRPSDKPTDQNRTKLIKRKPGETFLSSFCVGYLHLVWGLPLRVVLCTVRLRWRKLTFPLWAVTGDSVWNQTTQEQSMPWTTDLLLQPVLLVFIKESKNTNESHLNLSDCQAWPLWDLSFHHCWGKHTIHTVPLEFFLWASISSSTFLSPQSY